VSVTVELRSGARGCKNISDCTSTVFSPLAVILLLSKRHYQTRARVSMLPFSGTSATRSFSQERNKPGKAKSKAGLSIMGFSRKKRNDPSHKHNIDKIKGLSSRTMPAEFHYKPKVSQTFLENWLDFPVDRHVSVVLNSFKMWWIWLIWTNKGMAGLDPSDTTVRARICSQVSVLGTAAGLMLVIAVAGLLVPPGTKLLTLHSPLHHALHHVLPFTRSGAA
jgi:hypothetical protein